MKMTTLILMISFASSWVHAAGVPKGMPSLPSSGNLGVTGSVGIGFTDFTVLEPVSDFKLDRGTYTTVALERGFDFANLYFTMALGHMTGEGRANYSYTNLTSSTTYQATDVGFSASMYDLSLGFKVKMIDDYWFGPYIEAGGIGSYHEITYTSKADVLTAQGANWKQKDVVMGSGYYGEAGIDVKFSQKFGVKFAGRFAEERTKDMETLAKNKISFRSETYYFSALMGF
jgi:hypothetical protein